jgi:microcystin-dependent protein
MSEPFLAEIRIVAFNFPPKGWALCNGQLLPINQNQALFSLMGTMYGGNGQTNFALPNLRGRAPLHASSSVGEAGGQEHVTLTIPQMPDHTHAVNASALPASTADPAGAVWAVTPSELNYSRGANTTLSPAAITSIGGSQPHNNMQPYTVLNFIIALQGIYPSRN